MKQSEIYAKNEANAWFNRVDQSKKSFHANYILKTFNEQRLKGSNILELGCSGGGTLTELKLYVNSVFGVDLSTHAISSLNKLGIDGLVGNIADKNLKIESRFDIVMLPMVAMYIADDEFSQLVENITKIVSKKGFLYISDFIVQDSIVNINKHDERIKIYKRNLDFYINNFKDFNLIEYKLIHYDEIEKSRKIERVKCGPPVNDNDWAFVSLWQKIV
jgi:SAM-dependent methyltransferase